MLKRVGLTFNYHPIMNNFSKNVVDCLVHIGLSIVKLLLLPFNMWVKAIERLAEQRKNGLLEYSGIKGVWPFLSYCKRLVFDFLFDTVASLAYPLGVLFTLFSFIQALAHSVPFSFALGTFITSLISIYFMPAILALVHDLMVMALLPIFKLIDWFRKPAQWKELEIKNK